MARILQSLIARADERQFFSTQGNATHFAAEAKKNIGHLPGLKLKCIEGKEEEEFAEGIVVVESLSGKKNNISRAKRLNWVFIPPRKGIHNSLGIWILRCGFQIPDCNC